MYPVRLPVIAFAFFCISGCSTVTPAPNERAPLPEPALIESLPENVQSFELQGYKHFEDGSGGYSLRYANDRKRRIADVYIYPVAEENSNLEHNQLVLGSTRATLEAIGAAAQQGHYANFNVVNAGTHSHGLRTVARVQATYLRQNLASFTLVYQTEHEGTLLKIRVSMPDNESNRVSGEWDLFAEKIFETIIDDLEQTAAI
jgi:hypothetical protein